MDLIARQFRGILIAVIVLGLSAGAVFAGQVALQASTAGQSAEQTDQNGQGADENDNEAPDADETADAQETPEPPEANQPASPDSATGNHGALVSRAAQMATPTGFANHGAFVSCVAHMKDVADPATFDFSLVTKDTCAAAATARAADNAAKVHGKAGKHGKGHNQS